MPAENVKEIDVAKKKAEETGMPFIDLTGKIVSGEVLRNIPESSAEYYGVVPFAREGNIIKVGMIDPSDMKAEEAVRFLSYGAKLTVEFYTITPTAFRDVLRQYSSLHDEIEIALKDLAVQSKNQIAENDKDVAARMIADAPITKIVDSILKYAQEGRASDVHIEPQETDVKVRFRVDGILYTSMHLPKNTAPAIASRIKILTSTMKLDETRVPQDGRFRFISGNTKIDLRISTLPTSYGEKVVMRLLDPSVGLMGFEELGLLGRNLRALKKAIQEPYGMILLTGPTGSGKSTTLYTIMGTLNTDEVNIISLEDPIEYYINGVNQSQVKPEIDFTFASGLRSILRQDPDVIMVGEIRDQETAMLTVHAALTGHVVLSTLHTNNAIGVIPRLVDMGVDAFLLPSTINLAIAQRLVRRLCPDCKKPAEPSPKVLKMIESELSSISAEERKTYDIPEKIQVYHAEGCKFCGNKGLKGRIAIYEMLEMTPQLEKIITKEHTESDIEEESKRQGMVTMKQDGIIKALRGLVSIEEIMSVMEDNDL